MATRSTSLEALEYIKENGILHGARMRVYEYISRNGPVIQDEILSALSKPGANTGTLTARLGELEKLGCIITDGKRIGNSGRQQFQWRATNIVPEKSKTLKQLLKALGCDSLEEYYVLPWWKNRVTLFFSIHPRVCFVTGDSTEINLHHLRYDNIGCEPDEDLVPLCRKIHEKVHWLIKEYKFPLDSAHNILKDLRA